jgi:hypothetical protein
MSHANHTGINLREALLVAEGYGCVVRKPRRTGEYMISSPNGDRCKINGRRKDAPRELTKILNRLLKKDRSTPDH